jgi:hypothetical protein
LAAVKHLLKFIEPLANWALIRPVQIIEHVDGHCVYVSKLLMGANPLFVAVQMSGDQVPEMVCQLVPPQPGAHLSMHPWLHLDRCEKCHHEMVFLFDTIDGFGDRRSTSLREYPLNHVKNRSDLVASALARLGAS